MILESVNEVDKSTLVANLTLTKLVSNPTPVTGEDFIYTLQYSCSGTTDDCLGTFITDPLPPEVEFVSVSGSAHTTNESYDSGTHTVTFNFIGSILAGTTGEVQIVVRFPNGSTPNGTVATNVATIDATNASVENSNSVDATAVAADNSFKRKFLEAGTVLDENTAYVIEFCNPAYSADPAGTLTATNVTVIDTLPSGTNHVYSSSGGLYDAASHTVTWTTDTIKPGQCRYYTVFLVYPSTTFSIGQTITNNAAIYYTPIGELEVKEDLDINHVINNQEVNISTEKSVSQGSFYPGASGAFYMDWDNNSNISLDSFYLEDSIPLGIEITAIGLGAHYYNFPANIDLTIRYQTNLNSTWVTTPGSPHINWIGEDGTQEDVSSFGLAVGEYITVIRWEFGPDAMPISSGGYYDVVLDFDVMLNAAAGTYTNCYGSGYQGGGIPYDVGSCIDYNILPTVSGGNLNPVKSRVGGVLSPSDTETFQLSVRNEWGAGDSLENPIVYDLLPQGVTYQGGTWSLPAWGNIPGFPDPVFTYTADYNGTGRELLKWEWSGGTAIKIPPGERVVIDFDVTMPEVVSNGSPSFYNQFWIDADNIGACLGTSDPDIYDLDGDSDLSETFCRGQIGISIVELVSLESEKLVKGQLDSTWTKYPNTGSTLPGGIADYQLIVRNKGTVDMTDIVVIDILPAPNDSSVVTLVNRDSRWRPNLVGPVTAPSGVTVYYSTENNPCRSVEGIVPSGPVGCDIPAWTTIPPTDIASVQSLKFDFGTNILNPGDSILLEWPMRVPVGVLNTIGAVPDSIAWNSFGYIASRQDNGTPLPPGEPIKVGMLVSEQIPAVYGDFVWNDANANGLQDGGEFGIDNIRVDLYKDNGDGIQNISQDTFVNFTLTADGGYYLFPFLSTGDYYAIFHNTGSYQITTANQGGDPSIDSDGLPVINNDSIVAKMPITTLTELELDYSWDLGLLGPASAAALGGYVWTDDNEDGLQNEVESYGLNNIVVNLYENSNPMVVFATMLTQSDLQGNPGYYFFDNLPAGDYFIEAILPSASYSYTNLGPTGTSDPNDSDLDALGVSEVFTLVNGDFDNTWDAGFVFDICAVGTDNDGDGVIDLCDLDDDNDGIPDSEEGMVCSSLSPSSAIIATSATWIDMGISISTDHTYTFDVLSSTLGTTTVSGGPYDGQNLILTNFGAMMKDLDGNRYTVGGAYLGGPAPPISIPSANLTATDYQHELWYIGLIDVNGNGIYDAGIDVLIEPLFSVTSAITISAAVDGDLYAFFADAGSANNSGDLTFSVLDCERVIDTDGDNIPDSLDLDSDNDGIYDLDEAGHSAVDVDGDGIIDGAPVLFGTNGLFDALETSIDSDIINYLVANSESIPIGSYDAYTLDADGDGCFDAEEEGIPDADNDGIAGTGIPSVGGSGLVSTNVYIAPVNNNWQNPLIGPCLAEICSDGIDNDTDGFIDYNDPDCCSAKAPILSK